MIIIFPNTPNLILVGGMEINYVTSFIPGKEGRYCKISGGMNLKVQKHSQLIHFVPALDLRWIIMPKNANPTTATQSFSKEQIPYATQCLRERQ